MYYLTIYLLSSFKRILFPSHFSDLFFDVNCFQRHGEPSVVAVLVLAEQADPAVLVEVWACGALASWSGLAGAPGFPSNAVDPGCSCCLAS